LEKQLIIHLRGVLGSAPHIDLKKGVFMNKLATAVLGVLLIGSAAVAHPRDRHRFDA
jgi:hypothetical protein